MNWAESVVLKDPVLIQFLHVLLPRILPGEHLWPKDSQSFRTHFRKLCTDARLPPLPWRPYSLRRGGATAHFLQFGSLDKTAVRGRWQSTRTARLYVDEGVAALALSTVSTPAQERHIRSLAAGVATAQMPFSGNQNWQQVQTAADWISCSLPGLRRPFRGVRRVMLVPCSRGPASRWSRYLATAGLFDGTQLHGTPARRGIPRRPSNLTFVAVPKFKRNTSRRPPSALDSLALEVL